LELTCEHLERPPEETVRILALSFLDEAADGAKRMEKGDDSEALHDFRVGLRRLRSCLRAYRPYLKGSVSKKLRNRLKTLASSTNQARDTEVQLAWLEPQAEKLSPKQHIGLRWLTENLAARQERAQAPSLEKVIEDFRRLREDFIKKLSVCEYRLDLTREGSRPTFVFVTGRLIAKHLAELEEALSEVGSVGDQDKMHQARICGKRLRYLLEPLRKEVPPAKSLVKQFKSLQDILGELHDTHVLEAEISTALEKSAVEGARRLHEATLSGQPVAGVSIGDEWEERHGLLELLRLLKARGENLFSKLQAEYLGVNGSDFLRGVEELGKQLSAGADDIAFRRRFLLSRLPERTKGVGHRLIEAGWLPSKTEVLRRVRSGRGVAFFRILQPKTGQHVTERLSRKHFQTLWPLTERRRLRERRYEIVDDKSTWTMREFLERDLVIAEVDMDPGLSDVPIPEWVATHVKREVTGNTRYEDEWLATHPPRKRTN
jgi:CHAD domain-containing protein/CYTH domain-containing protein